jgi:NADH-quinone oxidoreductase subunit J
MEHALILFCSIIAITTAVMVILSKNTVHSALWMIGNCLIIAVFYLLLRFPFIAILQVMVYAGVIMMFILYAIMMLNQRLSDDRADMSKGRYILLVLFSVGVFILGVGFAPMALKGSMTEQAMTKFGEVNMLANYIFTEGLLPFELVSVLLTAAVVGAVYLTKKN